MPPASCPPSRCRDAVLAATVLLTATVLAPGQSALAAAEKKQKGIGKVTAKGMSGKNKGSGSSTGPSITKANALAAECAALLAPLRQVSDLKDHQSAAGVRPAVRH